MTSESASARSEPVGASGDSAGVGEGGTVQYRPASRPVVGERRGLFPEAGGASPDPAGEPADLPELTDQWFQTLISELDAAAMKLAAARGRVAGR